MNKTIIAAAAFCLALTVQAQNEVVNVELTNGAVHSYNVSDVRQMTFTDEGQAPEQSLAAPTCTIDYLKEKYWSSDLTGSSTIGLTADGKQCVIAGTIVSDIASQNLGGNIIIQDSQTGSSIQVYVRMHDVIESGEYRFGQQISLNVSGLQTCYFNGNMEICAEYADNAATPLTLASLKSLTRRLEEGAFPEPLVVTLSELEAAQATPKGLQRYQNRLVCIKDVEFEAPGLTLSSNDSNTNRYFTDAAGHRCYIRTMRSATFGQETIPAGKVSVTGILNYYAPDSAWQIRLNSAAGLSK